MKKEKKKRPKTERRKKKEVEIWSSGLTLLSNNRFHASPLKAYRTMNFIISSGM